MNVHEVLANGDRLLGQQITVEGQIINHRGLSYLAPYDAQPDDAERFIFIAMDKQTGVETLRFIQSNGDRSMPFNLFITGILSKSQYGPPFAIKSISQVSVYAPVTPGSKYRYVEFHRPRIDYEDLGFSKLPAISIRELLVDPEFWWDMQVRLSGFLTAVENTMYIADRNYVVVGEDKDAALFDQSRDKPELDTQEMMGYRAEWEHAVQIKHAGILGVIPIHNRFGAFANKEDSQVVGRLMRPDSASEFAAELVDVSAIAIKSGEVITVWHLT